METSLLEIANVDQPKRVLVGITGGIAAYKSADLVRRLKERGFEVRVVMTESASQFITPMTLQAVSANPVHMSLFDLEAEAAMGHIELAKWADIILVAPATANSIAKIAHGFSDNLLTTLIVASRADLIIAPAMNQQMWANQTTRSNIQTLKQMGTLILGPGAGEQACGDIGEGRMLEPLDIAQRLEQRYLNPDYASQIISTDKIKPNNQLTAKTVVITAGPTVEPIDPVRFISNHSSGKMGYALAAAAKAMGAHVVLISGPVSLDKPLGVTFIGVQTAAEMFAAVKQQMSGCDLFIGCAAVADYTPQNVAKQKIKKNDEAMNISLVKNPDIISWVAAQSIRPFVVGFAAESQNLKEFAQSKLERKKLDMICANDISNKEVGFNSEKNEILILSKKSGEKHLPANCKSEIAQGILNQVSQDFLVK